VVRVTLEVWGNNAQILMSLCGVFFVHVFNEGISIASNECKIFQLFAILSVKSCLLTYYFFQPQAPERRIE
jgi:hypothetical protein